VQSADDVETLADLLPHLAYRVVGR
jgi:hypothetical protein